MSNKKLNLSMECCKMAASVFVVLLHIPFPGDFGQIVNCLARFAVPTFFAVSGFFSYRVDSNRLVKRIVHILKLNVMGTLIYTFWGIFYTKSVAGGSVAEYLITKLSVTNLAKWFIINVNPFSGHLWYLSAILTCYVVLWVYVRFFDKKEVDYKPLYIVSICLILFQLALGVNAVASKTDIHYLIYRNALFFGLPMFCMGMFIKQYYTQIISSFNLNAIKEFAIMIFGAALSLLQWFGFGKIEMPVGMIITVIMLMLFLASHPLFTKQRFIITIVSRFGNISLIVYIIHLLYYNIFQTFASSNPTLALIKGNGYLYPLVIVVLSVISGVIFDRVSHLIKFIKRKIRR